MSNQPGGYDDCCPVVATSALSAEQAETAARIFKALGDPVRLRLYSMIASAADAICVCDLTGAFELTAPTISHHLKVLREAGLIEGERRGTWIYYRSLPHSVDALARLLDVGALEASVAT
ncbi:ArsR/SmtB family transcription factor [Epidermidibacterium keratini]|uniref:ArsR/SmtB family transcription factor n=1 Tax=Epidermidibacterium keratini TaxID=1891644 RepID=UPI00186595AE|nr:metalloregulator ArsR/SmtB family transcription factor [Epidermidibacterium keratini]